MLTENEKLKKIREDLKLTQTEFAKICDVSQQSIAMIENGDRNVSAQIKLSLLKHFKIDWDEVDTEKTCSYQYNSFAFQTPMFPVPYYSAKAAAGEGTEVAEYPDKDVIYFDTRFLKTIVGNNLNHLSLITAEGQSMKPTIMDGDLLMINDSIKEIVPNKIFVIRQDKKLRVKRLKTKITGEVLIISDNKEYEPEIMDKETEIIGQVVWNGNKEIV